MSKKWVCTAKTFKEAIRNNHLKSQLEFSLVVDILHVKRKRFHGDKKAPAERSKARVKLRCDTTIKIGRKWHTKQLEKIVWREYYTCFACIAAVTNSLVWAQRRLAWRRETLIALPTDFILELLCWAKFNEDKSEDEQEENAVVQKKSHFTAFPEA